MSPVRIWPGVPFTHRLYPHHSPKKPLLTNKTTISVTFDRTDGLGQYQLPVHLFLYVVSLQSGPKRGAKNRARSEGVSTRKHGDSLNHPFVNAIKKPGTYGDGHGSKGLRLIVKERAKEGVRKTWSQRILVRGKRCDLGIGSYPDVLLAEARDKARRPIGKELARAKISGYHPPQFRQ